MSVRILSRNRIRQDKKFRIRPDSDPDPQHCAQNEETKDILNSCLEEAPPPRHPPYFGDIGIEAGAEDGPHQRLIVGVHIGRPVQHVGALEELAAVQVLSQLALHAQQHAQCALGQEVFPAEPVLVAARLRVGRERINTKFGFYSVADPDPGSGDFLIPDPKPIFLRA